MKKPKHGLGNVVFLRIRVEDACPKCGGTLEVSARPTGGTMDCVNCHLYAQITWSKALEYTK